MAPLSHLLLTSLVWLLGLASAHAVTVTDLYEVTQPVTTSRDAAFVDALRAVLVRVSGRRDAAAQLGSLGDPRKYVQRFGFPAEDFLQVGFDGPSIDRLLSEAGLPIWGRERPATLVILNIERLGGEQWVSGDAPVELRAGVEAAARERALPLVWAALDSQDYAQAAEAMGSSSTAGLLEVAQAHGANAALVGRVRGASVRWLLAWSEGADESVGGLEAGVHAAADAYAQVFAAAGSSLESVAIEVAGLGSLDAYAATLNYLEKLTLVRSVALEQVAGDAMQFRLSVRGDAQTLLRALALDRRLAPVESADGAAGGGRLRLRYLP